METSLLHFSVHSHVAQMSAIELTGADDVTQAEEVGTIPSEVIFSDNSQYAYVMRRSPTAGVDLLTAYAMNSETGQLSILQSDPANSLFNRLLFSGSNGFLRPQVRSQWQLLRKGASRLVRHLRFSIAS